MFDIEPKKKKSDDELDYNAGDVIAGFYNVTKKLAGDISRGLEGRKKSKRRRKKVKVDKGVKKGFEDRGVEVYD